MQDIPAATSGVAPAPDPHPQEKTTLKQRAGSTLAWKLDGPLFSSLEKELHEKLAELLGSFDRRCYLCVGILAVAC